MTRRLACLLAVFSFSVFRGDSFANGFLLVSGVVRTLTSSLDVPVVQTDTRSNTPPLPTQGRTRMIRVFSQATKPESSELPEAPTPRATTATTQRNLFFCSEKARITATPIVKKKRFNASNFATTEGPDKTTKPDYENIHGPLGKTLDSVFLYVFRSRLAEHVGVDSKIPKTDFAGLMELTAAMNARYSDRTQIQNIAQRTLRSLFPSWLPGQFAILFARPFPEFSSRMNAWATYVAGQWLMGECEINDIEIDGVLKKDQGLLVKRCRFLEESGCASVCVNSCKIPTQKFFIEDMGLPLTMTPDYETHECQFSFGRMPTQEDDLDAMGTPCLSRCPTAGSMRQWHNGGGGKMKAAASREALLETEPPLPDIIGSQCAFMENPPDNEIQRLQP